MEKELNITDAETEETNNEQAQKGNASYGSKATGKASRADTDKSGREENIVEDIEAALAQLKKELGL